MRLRRGHGSPSYREAVLNTHPVAYWRLGEASGTVARDEMGANDGAYVGGPTLGVAGLLAGDPDTAVTFNGLSQWVSVPFSARLHPGDTFSIAGVVKTLGPTGVILDNGANDLTLYAWGGNFYASKNGVGNFYGSTSAVDWSTPRHVVMTKSGATVVAYLDGSPLAGTVTNQTIVGSGSATTLIGQDHTQGTIIAGTIDEVAVWDRAITPAEIADLSRIGMGR